MNRKIITPSVISISAVLLLSGCIFAPSGDDGPYDRRARMVEPTLGQELLDLERARDAGVITQAEFDRAKARILDERD